MSYNTETRDIREGLFRFGQWFGKQNIKFSYYRDPLARFFCQGCIDDGMSKGFDAVISGTEEATKWNDDFQTAREDHYKEFLQSIYFQRRDGKSLQMFVERESELFNFAGQTGQYRLYYNAVGKATKGTFNVPIEGFAGSPSQKLDREENDNFMELIIDRREKIGEGQSVLEPVWDVLFAIYMLISHSAYFVARGGAGIKDLAVDESVLTDTGNTSILTTLVTALSEFGSAADVIIRPKTLGGQPVDFDIKTVDSSIDFRMILDVYLVMLSAHFGIPKTQFEGLVVGQQAGAEVNEASYFDFLQDLQDRYVTYCKWFVRQLNKFYNFFAEDDEDFDILFRVRRVISEADEVALLKSKLEVTKQFKDLGIKTIRAFELGKLEGITEVDLREGIDQPIQFGQQFTDGEATNNNGGEGEQTEEQAEEDEENDDE